MVFNTKVITEIFHNVCSLIPGSLAQYSTVVSSPVLSGGVPPGDKNPWVYKSCCLSAVVFCAFTFLNLEHDLVLRSSW